MNCQQRFDQEEALMLRTWQATEFPVPIGGIQRPLDDSELLRRAIARMTPEQRGVAIVCYDAAFAQWQAARDPLFQACVSLYRQLTSPYTDVATAVRYLGSSPGRAETGDHARLGSPETESFPKVFHPCVAN